MIASENIAKANNIRFECGLPIVFTRMIPHAKGIIKNNTIDIPLNEAGQDSRHMLVFAIVSMTWGTMPKAMPNRNPITKKATFLIIT